MEDRKMGVWKGRVIQIKVVIFLPYCWSDFFSKKSKSLPRHGIQWFFSYIFSKQCYTLYFEFTSVLTSLVSTWHKLEYFGKRGPQLKNGPSRLNSEQTCGAFSWLMICGRAHNTVCGTTLTQVVLNATRKQTT